MTEKTMSEKTTSEKTTSGPLPAPLPVELDAAGVVDDPAAVRDLLERTVRTFESPRPPGAQWRMDRPDAGMVARMSRRTAGESLHPQPPPWASEVRRRSSGMAAPAC